MTESSSMKALWTPYFPGNQYQELLKKSIENHGVEVFTHDSPHPLSPFFHRVISADVNILHLHWTHPFFLLPDQYGRLFDRVPLSGLGIVFFAAVFLLQVALASVYCDRVVWTVHNKCNHERRYVHIDRITSIILSRLVDVIQVWDEPTQSEASSFFHVSENKLEAIPQGHYCDLYPDPAENPSQLTARRKLGINTNDLVFLYFGRIRRYKQVPELIETFQSLDLSRATLLIAGNPDSKFIENEIREVTVKDTVVLHLEFIPDEVIPMYFKAADTTIFPYGHIFNSGSAILAMSLAKPFVAPPYGAIPALDPGKNILYENLRSGLSRAYELDRESLRRIGEENREYVIEHHDWTNIGYRMKCMYSTPRSTEG